MAVGEADQFDSDRSHMRKEAGAEIAAWLWKFYEYGLPDTPGRMAKGIVEHLQAQGFVIIDHEDPSGAKARESMGPPVCTCEFKPCECEEEWLKNN